MQERVEAPGPKYSMMAFVAPLVVRMPASLRMMSFAEVHPRSLPLRRTPIILGILSSHSIPVITSTASAPPTPMASIPKPPALGVWESVPTIIPPGKA